MKKTHPRIFLSVRYLLGLVGLTLTRTSTRLSSYHIHPGTGRHDRARPLPTELSDVLRDDHPELESLRARYRQVDSPLKPGSFWRRTRRLRDFDLRYFRGDNAYVWQLRALGDNARQKSYLYGQYVKSLDQHKLFGRTIEDGAFGCWAFDFATFPTVSRDLLDSLNEIYFLDRHWDLLSRSGYSVVDVGAGYGRLAHRMVEAAPGLERYLCVDAIPESTFLCRHYSRYRRIDHKAETVPLDEVEERLTAARPDLAVNLHSFSEMPMRAIEGWIGLLARAGVPTVLIVPNEGDQLLSLEDDYVRLDYTPVLARHGYVLKVREPIILDTDVRDLVGSTDWFMLYQRADADLTTEGQS